MKIAGREIVGPATLPHGREGSHTRRFTVKFPVEHGRVPSLFHRHVSRETSGPAGRPWTPGAGPGSSRHPAPRTRRRPKRSSRPSPTRGASAARERSRPRRVTVAPGGPVYSSWRWRSTSTPGRPPARTASLRKAQRRCRGSRRTTGISGRSRARTRPGDPLPDPRQRAGPAPPPPPRAAHAAHEQRHPLRRRARAR